MNCSCGKEEQEKYVLDTQAGPIYGFHLLPEEQAEELAWKRDIPRIIEVLVWPYLEEVDKRPVLRRYYALNLPQAVARATEIEIRLREQELRAVLMDIRPATDKETNIFFRAMDVLESQMVVLDADELKENRLSDRIPMRDGYFGSLKSEG